MEEVMTSKQLENIRKIAGHYGYESQSRQCIEEMAELTQAINKLWRTQNDMKDLDSFHYHPELIVARERVVEKLADVQIMVSQLSHLLGSDEGELDGYINEKLDRQIKRMEEENAGNEFDDEKGFD